jgi:hypothetical protein
VQLRSGLWRRQVKRFQLKKLYAVKLELGLDLYWSNGRYIRSLVARTSTGLYFFTAPQFSAAIPRHRWHDYNTFRSASALRTSPSLTYHRRLACVPGFRPRAITESLKGKPRCAKPLVDFQPSFRRHFEVRAKANQTLVGPFSLLRKIVPQLELVLVLRFFPDANIDECTFNNLIGKRTRQSYFRRYCRAEGIKV